MVVMSRSMFYVENYFASREREKQKQTDRQRDMRSKMANYVLRACVPFAIIENKKVPTLPYPTLPYLSSPTNSLPLPSSPPFLPSSLTFSPPNSPGNLPNTAEARALILSQILFPEALDRLGRIRLVKESRATDVENRLIMMARTGQIRAKVTEEQLKELLGAVAEKEEEKSGGGRIVVNSRRKGYGLGDWDDDE